MDIRCFHRTMCVCVLILYVISLQLVDANPNYNVTFEESIFKEVDTIRKVECGAKGNVLGMTIFDKRDNSTLVSLTQPGECAPSSAFAACSFDALSVAGRVLITDLQEGETREYRCSVVFRVDATEFDKRNTCINVTRPTGTAPTSGPRTTRIGPVDEVSTRVPSPSTQAALFPTSVAVVILVVLIIVTTFAFILIGILCRQRRKSRKESPQVVDVETADYLEPVPASASPNAGSAQETPASSQNAALESDDYEDAEAVSGVAAQAVPRGPYETLEMSDMGLRSDYSQLGAEEPQVAQGRGDYYSSLQMSNVGVRSDYSELGDQHDTA